MQYMQQPPMQPLPPDVAHMAAAYQLGTLNAIYKPRVSNPLAIIGIALGVIIADILLLAILFILWDVVAYITIAIPIAAIAYAIYALVHSNLRVYEFTYGLIQAKGRLEVLRWDQIVYFWQEPQRNYYGYSVAGLLARLIFRGRGGITYTIQRQDGAMFSYGANKIHRLADFVQATQRGMLQAHMPMAIAAFQRGQNVPFGPWAVNQQGIFNEKGSVLSWPSIGGVTTNKTRVIILPNGQGKQLASAPLNKIPNIHILSELVNYALQNAYRPAY